jgi:hypothetical protein
MHAIRDVSVTRIVMASMSGFIVVARSMAGYRGHLESVVCNSLLSCGSDYSDVSCVDKTRANEAG